jgi:regulator of PEP synthase PpsR (kinase-PPPase family)
MLFMHFDSCCCRMIARRGWPLIDVTARSIDQAATMIMDLLERHRQAAGQKD